MFQKQFLGNNLKWGSVEAVQATVLLLLKHISISYAISEEYHKNIKVEMNPNFLAT